MSYTVYMHIAPNGKVYIGITSQPVKTRWKSGHGYRSNDHFFKAIKKYGWKNFEHKILFEKLEKEVAESIEIQLIRDFKSTNPMFGYNISKGGKSTNGYKHSKLTKNRISSSLTGVKHDEVRRENQRQTALRLWSNESHRKKMSLSHVGKHCGKNHPMSKKVHQFDLNGNLIRVFSSVGDAERFTGIDHRQICDCCNGKQKTSHGFVWKYLSDT